MSMYRVVHTGAQPGAALPEERESLDRSDIEFVLLGRCDTTGRRRGGMRR